MFEIMQGDGEVPGKERKKRKSSRRSSILKKSPARFPLDNLNPNNDDTESRLIGGKHSRRSMGRRVSFAEKLQIKEFHNNLSQPGNNWTGDDNQMLSMFGSQSSAQVPRKDQNIFNLFPDNPMSHEQDQEDFVLAPTFQRSNVNRPNDPQRRKRKSFDIFDHVDSADEMETSDEDRRGILNEFNETRLFENDEMEFTCHVSETIAGEETLVSKTRFFDDENMELTCPISDTIANQTVNIQQETVEPIKKNRSVVESFCSASSRKRLPSAAVNMEEGHSNASLIAAKYESNKQELMESASIVLQGKTKSDPPSIQEVNKGKTKLDPLIFHEGNKHIVPAINENNQQNIDDKENEVDAIHPNDEKENIVDADCYYEMLAQSGQSLLEKAIHDQTKRKVSDGHVFVQSLKTKESKTKHSTVDERNLADKSICESEEWYKEMIEKTDSLSHSIDDEMPQPQTHIKTVDERDLANNSIYKSEEWYQELIDKTDSLSDSRDDEMVQPLTNKTTDETEIPLRVRLGVEIGVGVGVANEGVTEPITVQSSKRARLDPDDGWKSNTSIISALLKLKEANTSVVTASQHNPVAYFPEAPKALNEGRNSTAVTNKSIYKSEEWYQQMLQREGEIAQEERADFDSVTKSEVPKLTRMSHERENITESMVAQSSKRAQIDSGDVSRRQESIVPFLKQLKGEKALVAKPCQEHSVRGFAKLPQRAIDDRNSTVLANKSIYKSEEWYRQMIEKADTPSTNGDNGEKDQDHSLRSFAKVPQRPRVDTKSTALAKKSTYEDKGIYEEVIEKAVTEKTPSTGTGDNQDYSFVNFPDVPQGKPIESASYLQDKENLSSSTAHKTPTQQFINQAGYKSGKRLNNSSCGDHNALHMHALAPIVDESLLRDTLSGEMPEIGRTGAVSALVGKIGSQVKSRKGDMNATQIEQRATDNSFLKDHSMKTEDPSMVPRSADYDTVITEDPIKADQLKLASATFVVEKPDQKPMCLDGDAINPAAEATMVVSPPTAFQFKPSETFSMPKNDPDAFINEAVEQEKNPHVGKNVELGKTYVKSKETFILPKISDNEASKRQRFSIGDIQRRAKNRMSWVSREKMIIASTPARGVDAQCLNDISAIQEETVAGLTMIVSEDRDDLVKDNQPQRIALQDECYGEAEQDTGREVKDDQPQRLSLEGEGYDEAKQDRDNLVADDKPQTLTTLGLIQMEQVDNDKTIDASKLPDEFPESLLQEEMPDFEEQEKENNDRTIVPDNIQDFNKNNEMETLLSLENDPTYRKRISILQEEKAEMEANLEELIKVLEDKQLDLMAMEEIKKDIEKDRKGLDERATIFTHKEKILEAKATELEIILEKKEGLKRENERLNKRAEELQRKMKEDLEQRECFVGLIEKTNRLLVWSMVELSRSRVVFKFKFCGLMLTVDFEEIDQEAYKISDILQWSKKIKSIDFQNNKHNFRTTSSEFVSSRLRKQVAAKCLQEKYRTTKNLNKLLHEVSSMVIAHKQLYADLFEVEVLNNLRVQDSDCLSSRFISPPHMLFTEFDLECRIKDKDGDHKIELVVRHVFAKDRTEIFEEILSKTKEGPMLFSRAAKQAKDFIFEAHKHYFKKPHKLTEPQLAIVDQIFASCS